jgi:putative oxidoreductase
MAIDTSLAGNTPYEHVGKLILRLALGGLILFHGVAKLLGGVDGISQGLAAAGLPSFIAFGVYVGEVLAPILVIVGWQTRIGALLIAVNMLFAIGLVHAAEIFALGQSGGWALELQGLYLFGAIVIALIGPGGFSIDARGRAGHASLRSR